MISFKKYFNLVTESPTMIRYGDSTLYMDEAAITFITSQDDFYAFQNVTMKIPKILHINDELKVVDTPSMPNEKDEMYHEELGSIFGLDLGINTEGMYVRGRLWVDPQDINRMLVSIWSYQDEFKPFKMFFESAVKKLFPKASEFSYEYAYFSQKGIDFAKEVKIKGISPAKIKKQQTEEEKLKKRRYELFRLWHTKTGPEKLKIENEGDEINRKLGLTDAPWAYKKAKPITKSLEPSWKRRDGD